MGSLKNQILISMPHMIDPYFLKSVIFICEHNKEGAMGIIINKRFQKLELDKSFKNLSIGNEVITSLIDEIYFGGPVNLEMGLFLHDTTYDIEGTLSVSKSVSLTSNKQIVVDLKNGTGPDIFRFSFGYAGWGKGQIEREIENGDWLIMPADDNFIFSIPNSDKWQKAASHLGIDIRDMGGSAGLA